MNATKEVNLAAEHFGHLHGDVVRDAGGIAMEFPLHPIFENCRRPTAALDRNLAYLGLVEILNGYPLDGVVLTTGCDKTTPACLMAAATVDIPAIALSSGPMLNGWYKGQRTGSGTIVWMARETVRNAFNEASIAELTETFRSLGADEDVRAIVLAGKGPAFCAGADLGWMKRMAAFSLWDLSAMASSVTSLAS